MQPITPTDASELKNYYEILRAEGYAADPYVRNPDVKISKQRFKNGKLNAPKCNWMETKLDYDKMHLIPSYVDLHYLYHMGTPVSDHCGEVQAKMDRLFTSDSTNEKNIPPIDVSIDDSGKFNLEDGRHRCETYILRGYRYVPAYIHNYNSDREDEQYEELSEDD